MGSWGASLSLFCVAMWLNYSELSSFLIMSLLIFVVFNVVTGRIFWAILELMVYLR